ncbi:MAG: hypothetical protein KAI17_23880 [Thiotrichaceae bacterium]|nr:hypothetical protein [Thiotrichaceae bacterium]
MPKQLFFLLLTLLSLSLSYTPKIFAHAGVDHGDNCFVHIGGAKLRLGGFQSEEKMGGGKHYCHLFPATGEVIFTFEQEVIKQLNKKMNLKFLAAASYWDVIFDYDNAFSQTLSQTSDSAMIQYNFPSMGLYAMEIELTADDSQADTLEPSQNNTQQFLFLVGFPIIKILVLVAFGFLLLLGFVLLKQLKAKIIGAIRMIPAISFFMMNTLYLF